MRREEGKKGRERWEKKVREKGGRERGKGKSGRGKSIKIINYIKNNSLNGLNNLLLRKARGERDGGRGG